MRSFLSLCVTIALLLGLVAAGCGGSGGESVKTTTVTVPRESGTEPPSQHPTRTHRSLPRRAEETVRRYYRAVDVSNYAQAWAMLVPSLQVELGGYATWRDGYRTSISTRLSDVHAMSASSTSATVSFDLEATDVDECGTTVEQTFTGSWDLESRGGRFRGAAFDVEKTGGETPVLDGGPCESTEEVPAAPTETSTCDPNYTGCVPISSFDVDCDEVGEEVEVVGEDIYGLDLEEDGLACEWE